LFTEFGIFEYLSVSFFLPLPYFLHFSYITPAIVVPIVQVLIKSEGMD